MYLVNERWSVNCRPVSGDDGANVERLELGQGLRVLGQIREIEIAELFLEYASAIENLLFGEVHEDSVWRV